MQSKHVPKWTSHIDTHTHTHPHTLYEIVYIPYAVVRICWLSVFHINSHRFISPSSHWQLLSIYILEPVVRSAANLKYLTVISFNSNQVLFTKVCATTTTFSICAQLDISQFICFSKLHFRWQEAEQQRRCSMKQGLIWEVGYFLIFTKNRFKCLKQSLQQSFK